MDGIDRQVAVLCRGLCRSPMATCRGGRGGRRLGAALSAGRSVQRMQPLQRSVASTLGSTTGCSRTRPSPRTSPSSMTQGRAPASASTAVAAACLRARLAGEPSPAGEQTARRAGVAAVDGRRGVSAELRGSAPPTDRRTRRRLPASDPAATSGPRRIGSSSPAQNTRRAFAGPAARVGRFEHGRFDAVIVASWRGSHRAASASARCRVARRAAVGPTSPSLPCDEPQRERWIGRGERAKDTDEN